MTKDQGNRNAEGSTKAQKQMQAIAKPRIQENRCESQRAKLTLWKNIRWQATWENREGRRTLGSNVPAFGIASGGRLGAVWCVAAVPGLVTVWRFLGPVTCELL